MAEAGHADDHADHTDEEADHDHSDHAAVEGAFAVSTAAQDTFGLDVAKMQVGSFMQSVQVPAFVRERPAVSNLQASCQLQGVVRKVLVQVGQSVREGDPLVELQLTGDDLATAQSVLLDSVQQLAIIEREIERLKPPLRKAGLLARI